MLTKYHRLHSLLLINASTSSFSISTSLQPQPFTLSGAENDLVWTTGCPGVGLVWQLGAVMCWFQMYISVCVGIISSCQLAATSEIAKHCGLESHSHKQ